MLPLTLSPAFCRRLLTLLLVGVTLGAPAHRARADELVLFIWDNYLAPAVVDRFRRETGHSVRQVIFDSDLQRDEVLAGEAGGQFDLVLIESSMVRLFGNSGYLQPLAVTDIDNGRHLQPRWRESCRGYAMPYAWGTVGIAWRSDKLAKAPTSWNDLLNPTDDARGHVGMLLDNIDTLIPPLKLLDYPILTADTQQLREAYALLQRQQPAVLHYGYPLSLLTDDPRGEALYMALVYSGDQYTMNGDDEAGPWRYVVPREGTSLWVDCIGVVATSPRRALAMQFIDFLNRPEVAAQNVNEIGFATVNAAAMPLIDEELRDDPTLFPPANVIETSEQYDLLDTRNMRQRGRILDALSRP